MKRRCLLRDPASLYVAPHRQVSSAYGKGWWGGKAQSYRFFHYQQFWDGSFDERNSTLFVPAAQIVTPTRMGWSTSRHDRDIRQAVCETTPLIRTCVSLIARGKQSNYRRRPTPPTYPVSHGRMHQNLETVRFIFSARKLSAAHLRGKHVRPQRPLHVG